jgi:predicted nucleotidyltransferase
MFSPIFDALNEAGVRYLVVGGVAVLLHGHVRFTKDLDLVIDLEPEAARRAMQALNAQGFVPKVPVPAEAFADSSQRELWIKEKNMVVFSLHDLANPLRVVDVFVRSPRPFEELFARSKLVPLGHSTVRVVGLEDLISIKREAGRPQDLLDVEVLEAIRGQREQGAAQ